MHKPMQALNNYIKTYFPVPPKDLEEIARQFKPFDLQGRISVM